MQKMLYFVILSKKEKKGNEGKKKMRKLSKIFVVLLSIMLIASVFALNASAVEKTENGLKVEIITDKEDYQANEDIQVTVKVTNTNDYAVTNVSIESLLPDGMTLKQGHKLTNSIEELEANGELELSFVAVVKKEQESSSKEESSSQNESSQSSVSSEGGSQNPNTSNQGSDSSKNTVSSEKTTIVGTANTNNSQKGDKNGNSPSTGDNTPIVLLIITAVLSLLALVWTIALKKKKATKISMIVFGVLLSAQIFNIMGIRAVAEEISKINFNILKVISVSNLDYEIKANIAYEIYFESDFELIADVEYAFVSDEEEYVEFYTKPGITVESIDLLNSSTNEAVGMLLEDELNEGIYSARIAIPSDKETTMNYYAVFNHNGERKKSNIVNIRVVEDFPEDDYLKMEEVNDAISNLSSDSNFKNLSIDAQVVAMKNLLTELANEGTAKYPISLIRKNSIHYTNSTKTFSFEYFNGLPIIIVMDKKDHASETKRIGELMNEIGAESLDDLLNYRQNTMSNLRSFNSDSLNKNLSCVIMQDWDKKEVLDTKEKEWLLGGYRKFVEEWSTKGLETTLHENPIITDYKTLLRDKDLIVLALHGAYTETSHFFFWRKQSVWVVTEDITKIKDKEYKQDIKEKRVIKSYSKEEGKWKYAITAEFFNHYYKNNGLENSIVFMGNCVGFGVGESNTNTDYGLSSKLLNLGANAVIGFKNEVNLLYGGGILRTTVEKLLEGMTIKSALELAKEKHGNDGNEFLEIYPQHKKQISESFPAAYPILHGNQDKKLIKTPETDFAGGNGSEENPYQVATAEQLDNVRNDLTAYYIQIADIDLSEYSSWEPIGNGETNDDFFSGVYDGQGYTIKNMSIKNDVGEYVGLFGVVDKTVKTVKIKNINMLDVNIDIISNYLLQYVGSVIGENYGDNNNFLLENCHVKGRLTVNRKNPTNEGCFYAGGVVGNGRVYNCSSDMEIAISASDDHHASIYVGGVIGAGNAHKSINHGNIVVSGVNVKSNIGGIIGGGGTRNCINYGSVRGEHANLGGIVGIGSSENCINYGEVTGKAVNAGGIVGWLNDTVSDCVNYANVTTFTDDDKQSSSIAGGIAGHGGAFLNGKIINCYNLSEKIFSTEPSGANRIVSVGARITNSYSIDNTKVNGNIPTDYIGKNSRNGASMTAEEIQTAIQYILTELNLPNKKINTGISVLEALSKKATSSTASSETESSVTSDTEQSENLTASTDKKDKPVPTPEISTERSSEIEKGSSEKEQNSIEDKSSSISIPENSNEESTNTSESSNIPDERKNVTSLPIEE